MMRLLDVLRVRKSHPVWFAATALVFGLYLLFLSLVTWDIIIYHTGADLPTAHAGERPTSVALYFSYIVAGVLTAYTGWKFYEAYCWRSRDRLKPNAGGSR